MLFYVRKLDGKMRLIYFLKKNTFTDHRSLYHIILITNQALLTPNIGPLVLNIFADCTLRTVILTTKIKTQEK